MLIEFSVGNYRSFKEPVTFSMVAANLVAKSKELDENNVAVIDKNLKLLKSAAVYGANASGKSNLAQALSFMKWLMVNSSRETQSTDSIGVEPFRLNVHAEKEPSYFEIVFLLEGRQYRYGFEATPTRIVSEWLFYIPTLRETRLFERQDNNIRASKKYEAEGIQKRTRDNALFLSVSAQFNVDIAENILGWVTEKLNIISGLHDQEYFNYTLNCLIEDENRSEIIQLVKKLDLGIDDVRVKQRAITISPEMLPADVPESIKRALLENGEGMEASIEIIHQKFRENGIYDSAEVFSLDIHESEGTRKLFSLAGLLIRAIKKGGILVIDEFDARLHPLISLAIVELFNSSETNPNFAQLVFMTHDTNLLSHKLFRRDQIWFTEKDKYGATDLYSLAEYKNVRNDASFDNNYIKGKYGAIPFVGDLKSLLKAHG